jgi:hypothetical protein
MKHILFASALIASALAVEHAMNIDTSDFVELWEEKNDREQTLYRAYVDKSSKRGLDHSARPVVGILTEPLRGDLFHPADKKHHKGETYAAVEEASYVPRTHV